MSEKGQGDESTDEGAGAGTASGTGIGIDGTASAGGGSAADQSGPHQGDTQTRDTGLEGLSPRDFPPPEVPEDAPTEPTFPGGGPTDTRSGWDYPPGTDGWRGDPAEWQGPSQAPEGPPVGTAEEAPNPSGPGPGYQGGPRSKGMTQIDPPSLDIETGTGQSNPENLKGEALEEYKRQNPSALKHSEDMKGGHGPIDVT